MMAAWNALTEEGKSFVCITLLLVEWFLLFRILA